MKIENSVPHPVALDGSPSRVKTERPAENNSKPSDKSTRQAGSKRIRSWFAQVGIQSGYGPGLPESTEQQFQQRRLLNEQRKINNLQRILDKALEFCLPDETQTDIDPDWFFSFINMAEQIHSKPMQELWGKIFAVEQSHPGTFSLNTLRILQQITHKEALQFRHAIQLASRQKGDPSPKILLGFYRKQSIWSFFSANNEQQLNLAQFGLSYPDLLSLIDLGLIHHSEIETGELPPGENFEWRVGGQVLQLRPKSRGLTLVYFKFTTTGSELSKLVNHHKHDHYLFALKRCLSVAFELDQT